MKKLKLGDVCLSITDGTHTTVVDDKSGTCFLLSCKNIKNGCIMINENDRKISVSTMIQLRNRTKMEMDDVLLTTVGTIGQSSIVKDNFPNYEFQRSVAILKPNKDIINHKYLHYFLISPLGQNLIRARIKGAVQSCLFLSDIKELKICVPNLFKQQHIVNILGTIDDKIENNENLVAKINESTKLFYINFCNNGFVDDVLENYIENYDRQRKPLSSRERDSLEKIYPYYGATEVLDYVDNYLFDGDYLLMGEDGTVADSLGFPIVQRVNEKFWANNHTHILKAKNGIDNNVLELILKNTNVQSIITGAVQPKINQANMNSLKIKVPNDVETLMKTIVSYFEKRQSLIDENKKLNKLKQQYLKKFFN